MDGKNINSKDKFNDSSIDREKISNVVEENKDEWFSKNYGMHNKTIDAPQKKQYYVIVFMMPIISCAKE